MSASVKFVNISGTRLEMLGSNAVQFVLLCGVSGAAVIPLAVQSDGVLLTSGPQ